MPEYRLTFKASAAKELRRLDQGIAKRLAQAIRALATEPRPSGCKKLIDVDLWRVRVGDYRILYRVNHTAQLVEVRAVAHRSEAYSR